MTVLLVALAKTFSLPSELVPTEMLLAIVPPREAQPDHVPPGVVCHIDQPALLVPLANTCNLPSELRPTEGLPAVPPPREDQPDHVSPGVV